MMLSLIRGLLGGRSQPAAPSRAVPPPQPQASPEKAAEPVVLSFRLALASPPSQSTGRCNAASGDTADDSEMIVSECAATPRRRQRRRVLSLQAAGLGSAGQRRALRSLEIHTTKDLLAADPTEVARQLDLSPTVAATLRRWQRAIRLSHQLPAMTPLDALLMRAIHRSTLRSIAAESAPRLHRDLVRYAMSTAGNRLLGERALPSAERVKGWVAAARERMQAATNGVDRI